MNRNVHLYQTDLVGESRVIRHCKAISESDFFDQVIFVGSSTVGDEEFTFEGCCSAKLFFKKNTINSNVLVKLLRIKQIEDNDGETLISEGVDGNYFDILNYSVFALIKIGKGES